MTSISLDHFRHAGVEAGNVGRLVIKKETDKVDTLQVEAQKYSFKELVLQFLSHVPLFKNMEQVRSFIRSENTSTEQVVDLLRKALEATYESMPTSVAINTFGKGKPLNEAALKEIIANAEKYYGIGQATKNENRVTINLWPYESAARPGHASITIKNNSDQDQHVSWWPKNKYKASEKNNDTLARVAQGIDNIFPNANLAGKLQNKVASSLASYPTDMNYEISDSGEELLTKAANAWDEFHRSELFDTVSLLSTTDSDDDQGRDEWINVKDAATELDTKSLDVRARPTQIRFTNDNGDQEWGVVAQRINLPMSGQTTVDGQTKTIKFGLDSVKISAEAERVLENAEAHLELAKAERKLKKHGLTDDERVDIMNEIRDLEEAQEEIQKMIDLEKNLSGKSPPQNFKTAIEKQGNILSETKNALTLAKDAGEIKKLERKIKTLESNIALASKKEAQEAIAKIIESPTEKLINDEKLITKLREAQEAAEKVGPAIGYRFASDTNNCASMVINILKAGGAEDFVPLPKMTTLGMSIVKPDKQFANYILSLQKEMDRLNTLSDQIDDLIAARDTGKMELALHSMFDGRKLNKHEVQLHETLAAAIHDSKTNTFQIYA